MFGVAPVSLTRRVSYKVRVITPRGLEGPYDSDRHLESAILDKLVQGGTCSLEELAERLPSYSRNQMFFAVDRLTQDGTVSIKYQGPVLCLSRSHRVDPSKCTV